MVRRAYSLISVSAPFTLTVLNIQLFPDCTTICITSFYILINHLIVFLCLYVNCIRIILVYPYLY